MSDRRIQITSFKYGLDTRRSELSVQPGTLMICENGFINAGGEVEKRKAFVKDAVLFPADTFGLETTDVGLMTFYSGVSVKSVARDANNDATFVTSDVHGYVANDVIDIVGVTTTGFNGTSLVVASVPTTTSFTVVDLGSGVVTTTADATGYCRKHSYLTLPTGVTAQRLAHPYGMNMTAVTASCNYKGKAFVIARYGTDWLFFYNGTLVQQSRNGVVLNGMLNSNSKIDVTLMATDLVRQAKEITGWSGTPNIYPAGSAYSGMSTIKSPTEVFFTAIPEVISSTNGRIEAVPVDKDGAAKSGADAPVTGVAAIAKFKFATPTAGDYITITAPAKSDGTGTVVLCDLLALGATVAADATSVSNQINLTHSSGYSAVYDTTGNVFVTAPTEWGALANSLALTITITLGGGGTTSVVASTDALPGVTKVTFDPEGIDKSNLLLAGSGSGYYTCSIHANTQGGTGSYRYDWKWSLAEPNNPNQVARVTWSNDQPVATLFCSRYSGAVFGNDYHKVRSLTGTITCEVMDLNDPNLGKASGTMQVNAIFP